MTTNNHPANGPVSLDRLHQIHEILSKAAAQSDGGNLGYAMADAVKVIDSAIAAFGAEPVEFLPDNLDRALTILGVALPISKEEFNFDAERWTQRLINRVIRLESELIPPAPVVPDEKRDEDGNTTSEFDHGWNACRAAMLHGAEPVSNRDELQVIGWLRSDYNSDDKRDPNAPLFMLGSNDPSEAWGVKYIPLSGNSPVIPGVYLVDINTDHQH
ncbi:hypothetical protein ACK1TF_003887 [Salmonella enterica]